jgi:hypothetical protein
LPLGLFKCLSEPFRATTISLALGLAPGRALVLARFLAAPPTMPFQQTRRAAALLFGAAASFLSLRTGAFPKRLSGNFRLVLFFLQLFCELLQPFPVDPGLTHFERVTDLEGDLRPNHVLNLGPHLFPHGFLIRQTELGLQLLSFRVDACLLDFPHSLHAPRRQPVFCELLT